MESCTACGCDIDPTDEDEEWTCYNGLYVCAECDDQALASSQTAPDCVPTTERNRAMATVSSEVPDTLAETLLRDLAQFTGTEQWYRHGMVRSVFYTAGVQYLAEKAGAYWLLDLIAMAQRSKPRVRAEGFQVWKLTRTKGKNSCIVTCDDGNGHIVYRQCIPFTDFPLETITLYCVQDGPSWVVMLTSEY